MKPGGSFMVARTVWEHPAFAKGEFSEREAFLWLISEAAWKPRTVRVSGTVADLERGQLCASVRFMADAWGWSKSRVARFLDRLRDRGMIEKRDSSGTAPLVVTLCNYEKFQSPRDSDETQAGQQRDSSGTNENKGIREKESKSPPTPRKRGDDTEAVAILIAVTTPEVAADFAAHRRAMKKALTPKAASIIAKQLARHHDPTAVLEASIANGWQGIFPDKIKEQRNEPPHSQQPRRPGGGQSMLDAAARASARFRASGGDPGGSGGDGGGEPRMDFGARGNAVVALFPA